MVSKSIETRAKTLAVHLHLFYIEQLPRILPHLKSLNGVGYDLFVSMVQKNKAVEKQIKDFNPKAQIYIVENKGYDIGPFIDFLHKIDLDQYKYILKIHTKNEKTSNLTYLNNKRFDNKLWKELLFDALLNSKKDVLKKLDLFEQNPKIGMISSRFCITAEKRCYDSLLPQINNVMLECGFNKVDSLHFVAGTMFYVRTDLLKPLLRYTINDFSITNGTLKDGTFAHAMERVLGALVESQSYLLYGCKHKNNPFKLKNNYHLRMLLFSLKRFIFQYKKTKHRKLVKIFKIPVYSKKEAK